MILHKRIAIIVQRGLPLGHYIDILPKGGINLKINLRGERK